MKLIEKENLYEIYDNKKILDVYFLVKKDFIVISLKDYIDISLDIMIKAISLFTNKFIFKYNIKSIIVENYLSYKKAFYINMYYEKSNYLLRNIEDIRYKINKNAFDDFGYIINQSLINNVKFGLFNSNNNGCGWIACYNLFKILNKEKTISSILNDLSNPFLFALNVYTLFRYLLSQNINAYFTPIFKKQCIRDIKESKCGIILYIHTRGSHYLAYKYLGNNKILIYNVVYGLKNHILDIEEFYKKYSVSPLGMLISVK